MSRDAGPTRQELTLTTNLMGGYDDNLAAGLGSGASISPRAMASGYTESLDVTLDYFRGNTARLVRLGSTGTLLAYPGNIDTPVPGGEAHVDVQAALGRTTTVRGSERVSYESLFSVYADRSSRAVGAVPAAGDGATAGAELYKRPSLGSTSSAGLDHSWTRSDTTSISYSYNVRRYTKDDYGDSRAHNVVTQYRRSFSRGLRTRAAYTYSNREYTTRDGGVRPDTQHRLEAGPEITTVLSRERTFTLSFEAGATYVESIGTLSRARYHEWVPTGSARATLDLSASWALQAGYRRDFSLLAGVTDEVYRTDSASLMVAGPTIPRTQLRVGATYSSGKTSVASGIADTFETLGGELGIQVAISSKITATAGYYYYQHHFSDPGRLPAGFPAKFDRNAVRVGLTVFAPLVGRSAAPPARR